MSKKYYRLERDMGTLFPKGSVWCKDTELNETFGNILWRRADGRRVHTIGEDFWFYQMLEQESKPNPYGSNSIILVEVEKVDQWKEV